MTMDHSVMKQVPVYQLLIYISDWCYSSVLFPQICKLCFNLRQESRKRARTKWILRIFFDIVFSRKLSVICMSSSSQHASIFNVKAERGFCIFFMTFSKILLKSVIFKMIIQSSPDLPCFSGGSKCTVNRGKSTHVLL